ncbi:cytochrome P450 [Blastomonas fulva]|jgi:cytochrome P450|uniref:cytochrome P450 n=1 Tax=Blastomonas fulva TaxID=1550728 RepID=UPI003D295ECF
MLVPQDSIPENVPADLVVDFDFFALDQLGKDDIQLAWATLHDGPDIVWTPHNGGHWIATRGEDIDVMQVDYEHFSHKNFNLPRSEMDQYSLPLGLDPPHHTPFRKSIMPAFGPRMIKALEGVARDTARELVAQIAPRGHCEFIEDFAKVLPINVFLGMVDLPLEHRHFLLEWAEVAVRSPDLAKRMEVHGKMREYLTPYIDARMQTPGDDVISMVITGDIGGRPPSRDEVFGMSTLLLFGGLDTVASQLGFIALHLARNPAQRRELIEHPELRPRATEELIRRFGLPNTARVLTQDYAYKGLQFRKGDMIQLPKCLYGLDDRQNEDPLTVDFHRKPSQIKHAAFGAGPHICPGASLARRELMVFMDEWLPLIPDFEIDPDKPLVMKSGPVNGVLELHLKWQV